MNSAQAEEPKRTWSAVSAIILAILSGLLAAFGFDQLRVADEVVRSARGGSESASRAFESARHFDENAAQWFVLGLVLLVVAAVLARIGKRARILGRIALGLILLVAFVQAYAWASHGGDLTAGL